MAEREPPDPTPQAAPEGGEGVRAPGSNLAATQRPSSAQEFWRRMDTIEDAIRDIAGATRELAQRVGTSSEVVPMVAELAREVSAALERMRVDVDSVRTQLARQSPSLEERLGRVPAEVGDALGTTLRSSVEAISDRTAGALDGLKAATSGLEERLAALVSGGSDATQTRLGAALDALATQVRTVEGRLEDQIRELVTDASATTQERLAEIRTQALEPLEGLRRQVADAMAAVRDAVTEVAVTQTTVDERLDSVRERVVQRTEELEAGLADALTGVAEAIRDDQQRMADRLSGRVGELRDGLEQVMSARLAAIEDVVTSRVMALEGAVRGALDETAARAEAAAERLASRDDEATAGRIAQIARAAEEAAARSRESRQSQERVLTELRSDLETLIESFGDRLERETRTIGEAVEKALGEITAGVAWVSPSMTDIGGRVDGVLQTVDEFRSEAGDLRAALGEVQRLADALESIGRRRGLKELAETDRRVAEQQAALVERLTSAGDVLTDRITRLEQQLSAAIDAGELGRLQAELTERIGAELARLQSSVAEELERRVADAVGAVLESVRDQVADAVPKTVKDAVRTEAKEALPGKTLTKDLRDIAKAQKDVDKVIASVRAEVADVKKRIDTWGKSRGAPRLAQELAAVERRMGDVERLVQEDLVEAVFDRMQRAFDRRFDALIQLIDARLQPPDASLEQRRGLFRRRE